MVLAATICLARDEKPFSQAEHEADQAMSNAGCAGIVRPRVLVVDDDHHIQDFLGLALEDEGFEVETARNGQEALDKLGRVDAGARQPHVIVLDLWMPVMDGPTFLRKYRQKPGPHAAVIALTAAHYDGARQTQVDADGFLTKPFSLDALIDLVRQHAGPVAETGSS